MVSGIAMGLISEGGQNVTLTDILGAENAIGDTDFKEVGERFLGTVVKTTTFGAFVSLLPGKDGLLHITQIRKLHGGARIENVDDVIKVGDKIQVEIRQARTACCTSRRYASCTAASGSRTSTKWCTSATISRSRSARLTTAASCRWFRSKWWSARRPARTSPAAATPAATVPVSTGNPEIGATATAGTGTAAPGTAPAAGNTTR